MVRAVFDPAYYVRNYPDVAAAGGDPLTHFLRIGWAEGRNPSALFDTELYLEQNPDVAEAGLNPLVHYLSIGAREGRQASRLFDADWYLAKNPDIADAARANPLLHYLTRGAGEGREANPLFDQSWYLAQYPQARGEASSALAHYAEFGLSRRLSPHPWFDAAYYLKRYPDVAAAGMNPLAHFLLRGHLELRDPHPSFNAEWYLATYGDVAAARMNPLLHYIWEGVKEGRLPGPEAASHRVSASASPPTPNTSGPDKWVWERSAIGADFDADFYRRTNPDVSTSDPLAHFLETGWREGRDPSPAFSIEFYLTAHPDVKKSGMNPFVHYCATGKLEMRTTMPSTAIAAQQAMRSPHLAVVAMVRNEGDIIDAFIQHLLALFDEIVIIDHGSQDGTREYLTEVAQRFPQLVVYDLKVPGYIQAQAMNFIVEASPALRQADWVFLLDADEFLPFENKTAFIAALEPYQRAPIIQMPWRNVVPAEYWSDRVNLSSETEIAWSTTSSRYNKIAIQPKRLRRLPHWIAQGNHAVLVEPGGPAIDAAQADFDVIHLPIRSAVQFHFKLGQGILAYERLGESRDKSLGAHWFAIRDALKDKSLTPNLLNGVALRYGERAPIEPISLDLVSATGRRQRIGAAFSATGVSPPPPRNINHLLAKLKAAAQAEQDSPSNTPVALRLKGAEIRPALAPRSHYEALPPSRANHPEEVSDVRFLADLLRPSYWDITHLTPSAWTGHLPFMFCLATLLRPRRFVELGTHFGASFFAYCQAAERGSFPTEAIAVDCWEGDEHAGRYDSAVFDQFKYILKNYNGVGAYLRMLFNDAAKLFDDGSVDLLHIDGLHTYEAVREDYETWLPKMSDAGTILFHDINVHERDFGVWRFWKEIRRRHPTMEFRHSHGLGVAYVGKPGASNIERLIRLASTSEDAADLIQQHFEEIAQKSSELFTKRWDMKARDAQIQNLGALSEDLTRLKQELAAAKRESEEFRKLAAHARSPT